MNEQQKKSLKEVNDLEKDLRDYSEVKGSIKAIKKNLENKNRFARWVAGLKPDIEILDGSIKMLTGKVRQVMKKIINHNSITTTTIAKNDLNQLFL